MNLQWEAIGLYFHLLDKSYHKLLSYDLDFTGLERYFFILWAIAKAENPLSQQNLADLLKVDKATIVRIIDDLEDKGYIKRFLNEKDKRAYTLALGKKGERYIQDIQEGIRNLNEELLFNFSPREKEIFLELLHKAYQNLSQEPQSDFFLKFIDRK
ncbi:MarR family winged helix-turn-helix transcriptional regulator [Raineya orbicola]|jgi:DNA-binding MarR family transcriptional regulator|uniref:Transcriptional regulator n=1 Tax=Raineya orbicola TaxID=2016530 RepID=A0A2N3I9G4_9BACT|nr:MarR family transcriptional regulator [Raineya orbicola]PKQ66873.1 Transcriptional regulator [Raineya orbicola]